MQIGKARVIITSENFSAAAAEFLAELIGSIAKKPVLISLSGGSTPFPVYRRLADNKSLLPIAAQVFWLQTDERIVAADDPRSNQKAIIESLFTDSVFASRNFFAVDTDVRQAEIANTYAGKLQRQLPSELCWPGPIDLAILGIGADGHTASLFPDFAWQHTESESGFTIVKTVSQPEPRLSLTINQLMSARHIVFLVSGSAKEEIVYQALCEPDIHLPAAWLTKNRETTWILAKDTSGRLESMAT